MQIIFHPITTFTSAAECFSKKGSTFQANLINRLVIPILLSFNYIVKTLPAYFFAKLSQNKNQIFIATQSLQKHHLFFANLFCNRAEKNLLLLSSEFKDLKHILYRWLLDIKKEEAEVRMKAIEVLKKAYLEKVTKISLAHLNLTSIPDVFNSFKNLSHLDLQDNPIQVLPKSIFGLKNLKTLILANTQISFFPDSFNELTELEEINLSMNRLKEFPSFILNLTKAKTIDLSHNLIKKIPTELSTLKKLEILDVGYNQITLLPIRLSKVVHLKQIDLTHNHISFFPSDVIDLFFHKKVILKQNPFSFESYQYFSESLKKSQKKRDCFSCIQSDVDAVLTEPLFLTLSLIKRFADQVGEPLHDEFYYRNLLDCPLINPFLMELESYFFEKTWEQEPKQAYAKMVLTFINKICEKPLFFSKADDFMDFFIKEKQTSAYTPSIKVIGEFLSTGYFEKPTDLYEENSLYF